MALFAVTLNDQTTDFVEGDAYQQEGPLMTFFSFTDDRHVIDSWSTRLASYRTADITAIRRNQPGQRQRTAAEASCGHRQSLDDEASLLAVG